MNNRLQQFLTAENTNQSQFADSIGVARASISHILAGRNKPGYDFIENTMKRYPALNIEWLLTGRGRMYKAGENSDLLFDDAETVPATQKSSVDSSPDSIVEATRKIRKILVFYDDDTYKELP